MRQGVSSATDMSLNYLNGKSGDLFEPSQWSQYNVIMNAKIWPDNHTDIFANLRVAYMVLPQFLPFVVVKPVPQTWECNRMK